MSSLAAPLPPDSTPTDSPAAHPVRSANGRAIDNVPAGADAEASHREYAVLRRGVIFALVLSCAVALSLNLVDPDLWGHVKYGQELLADRRLPDVATHTYTAAEYPWINHENLAEIAMAVGYEWVGPIGLLIAKCCLGMAILGLMVLVARWHAVGALVAWGWMLLVATNLTAFFPIRPQLLSFLWCSLVLVALDRAFSRWHHRQIRFGWLWCVPPIFVLWANSHGGFVAGLAIFLAYLVGRAVELVIRRRRAAPNKRRAAGRTQVPGGSRRYGDWKLVHLAAIAMATSAATLANPYGVRLPLWLASSLGRPRPEITEWAAPRPGDPVFTPFLVLGAAAAIALYSSRRRRDWVQITILALVGVQAVFHLRHIAFFALLCGFWLTPHVAIALASFRHRQPKNPPDILLAPWVRRLAALAIAGAVLLQGYALATHLTQLPVPRSSYPIDAFRFMVKHGISGKLVVSFNWAQYAIAAFAPDSTVQFDGRFRTCYPQKIVDLHFDFLLGAHDGKRHRDEKSGAIDGRRALSHGGPDLVLIDRDYEHAVAVMADESTRPDAQWVLLYQDGIAQLWGRRSRFDDPSSPDYLPPEERAETDADPAGDVPWPALPPRAMECFRATGPAAASG